MSGPAPACRQESCAALVLDRLMLAAPGPAWAASTSAELSRIDLEVRPGYKHGFVAP